eukprot:scaffold116878_cov63-Phaeocystis_antarctica.AAC.1
MAAGWFRAWRVRAMLRRLYLRRQQATATAKDRDDGLAGTRDDHTRALPHWRRASRRANPFRTSSCHFPGLAHATRLAQSRHTAHAWHRTCRWLSGRSRKCCSRVISWTPFFIIIEDGAQASVCSQWADAWKALRRKLPLRVRAQRQRRAQQSLAVADPHRYRPLALLAGQ